MPIQTPFHSRTAKLCTSMCWKDRASYAVLERAAEALGAGARIGARIGGLEPREVPGARAARAIPG